MTREEKEVAWERINDQLRDDKMTDFLDEIILERTAKNPDFPKMVDDKMTEASKKSCFSCANWAALPDGTGKGRCQVDEADFVAAGGLTPRKRAD